MISLFYFPEKYIIFYIGINDFLAPVEKLKKAKFNDGHIVNPDLKEKIVDNIINYILASDKISIGDEVVSGRNKDIKIGNCMPLMDIPAGTDIHNIELSPNGGGKIARSAGSFGCPAWGTLMVVRSSLSRYKCIDEHIHLGGSSF